ncbi:uncharacterized protein [Hyperolius riggenbachi]|uniref:uncharacterized protein n=1 Tax=Hyperolius riggenbachi TaxID=752182 RepID=UPI0035A37FDC
MSATSPPQMEARQLETMLALPGVAAFCKHLTTLLHKDAGARTRRRRIPSRRQARGAQDGRHYPLFTPSHATPPHAEPEKQAEESSNSCPICLSDLEGSDPVLTLQCTHQYHLECMLTWLRDHNTCPLCRCIAFYIMIAITIRPVRQHCYIPEVFCAL